MTQSPHIIIVDDEAPAREMVGDYLKMHGFGVTLCDGGSSLRQSIAKQMPDLIVLVAGFQGVQHRDRKALLSEPIKGPLGVFDHVVEHRHNSLFERGHSEHDAEGVQDVGCPAFVLLAPVSAHGDFNGAF